MKNRLKILMAFISLPVIFLSSCGDGLWGCIEGNGRIATESRYIGDFENISSSGSFIVEVDLGNDPGLQVEADENLLPYIRTTIQGNTLVLETKSGRCLRSRDPIRIFVDAQTIDGLSLSGSGVITCDDIVTKDLEMKVSGSGKIDCIGIDADNLELKISGSGEIVCDDIELDYIRGNVSGSGYLELTGNARTTDYDVSGSGQIKSIGLQSQVCYADISGSGIIYTWVEDLLDVQISGSGNLYYRGDPEIHSDISGSGNIRIYK